MLTSCLANGRSRQVMQNVDVLLVETDPLQCGSDLGNVVVRVIKSTDSLAVVLVSYEQGYTVRILRLGRDGPEAAYQAQNQ